MDPDFHPPVDVDERAGRCIRANHLNLADTRITALINLVKALGIKLIQHIRAGAGLVLKEVPDPSNLRPHLATIKGFGAFSDLEVGFLICAKVVCGSLTAPRSLGAMVLSRQKRKITDRVHQIRF